MATPPFSKRMNIKSDKTLGFKNHQKFNSPASLKGMACGAKSQNLLCISVNWSHEIHSQLP